MTTGICGSVFLKQQQHIHQSGQVTHVSNSPAPGPVSTKDDSRSGVSHPFIQCDREPCRPSRTWPSMKWHTQTALWTKPAIEIMPLAAKLAEVQAKKFPKALIKSQKQGQN